MLNLGVDYLVLIRPLVVTAMVKAIYNFFLYIHYVLLFLLFMLIEKSILWKKKNIDVIIIIILVAIMYQL